MSRETFYFSRLRPIVRLQWPNLTTLRETRVNPHSWLLLVKHLLTRTTPRRSESLQLLNSWNGQGNLFYSAKAGRFDPVTYFIFVLSFCYRLWTWTRGREQSYMCPNIIFGNFILFSVMFYPDFVGHWTNYKQGEALKEIIELCELWLCNTCGIYMDRTIKLELTPMVYRFSNKENFFVSISKTMNFNVLILLFICIGGLYVCPFLDGQSVRKERETFWSLNC